MTEHSTSFVSVASTSDWQPQPPAWVNGTSWPDDNGQWIAKPVPAPEDPDWFRRAARRMAKHEDDQAKENHPRIDYEHPDEWDMLEI